MANVGMEEQLSDAGDFINRTTRLTVIGIIQIVIGVMASGLALLILGTGSMASQMAESTISMNSAAFWLSALIYALVGAFFIGMGIGSVRKKRWVRPVALSLMIPGLILGTIALFFLIYILPTTLETAFKAPAFNNSPELMGPILVVVMVFSVIFGAAIYIGIPLLHVLVFLPQDVKKTLESCDPKPGFTDGRPLPVFGLSLWLCLGALTSLAGLVYSVFPFFGMYLTGTAGALGVLASALIMSFLAWQVINGSLAGYWGTLAYIVLMGISYNITSMNHSMADLMKLTGVENLPTAGVDMTTLMDSMDMPVKIVTNLSFALGIGFMVYVKKFFK